MGSLYNEIEPFAVEWLKNLSAAGHISSGSVDDRSIRDLTAADVRGATQAHFFAGIGVWSYALRLAGVPDDFPVWTGSCPCQPFSAAGRRGGFADERHLWPEWFRLISECRPPVIFGEQVASPDGLGWLDAVSTDLEGADYAVAAADLCAAGVGAPHIRQRLYFVAVARDQRCEGLRVHLQRRGPQPAGAEALGSGAVGHVADALHAGRAEGRPIAGSGSLTSGGGAGFVADDDDARLEGRYRPDHACQRLLGTGGASGQLGDSGGGGGRRYPGAISSAQREGDREREEFRRLPDVTVPSGAHSPTRGFWANADWIPCRDGKLRPVEPGTFPLAHGASARVGRLRAYGNAIVAPLAATFIRAALGL